jgi:hypothetical protein
MLIAKFLMLVAFILIYSQLLIMLKNKSQNISLNRPRRKLSILIAH